MACPLIFYLYDIIFRIFLDTSFSLPATVSTAPAKRTAAPNRRRLPGYYTL
jgi:hypothetical protein